jgi:prophage regulatory protein
MMTISRDDKLLTIEQVASKVALSKSSIYRRLDSNDKQFDPTFPRGYKLGDKTVRWLESEIIDWIMNLIQDQRAN